MVTVAPTYDDPGADRATIPARRVQPTSPVARAANTLDQWTVVAVDLDGGNPVIIPTAHVLTITWTKKNAPVEATFDMSLDDITFSEIDPTAAGNVNYPGREVQFWLNGHLIFWGKVVTRRANSTERIWHLTCKDPTWYLTKRNIGNANRTDYLLNGDFELSGADWTSHGSATVTYPGDTVDGTKCLHFTGSGGADYLSQQVTLHAGPIGLAVFLTVWHRIDAFTGPAPLSGAAIIFTRLGTLRGGIPQDLIRLTSTSKRNVWQRDTLLVTIPPNQTATLEVQLWSINGQVRYDACTMVVEESLDWGTFGAAYDQASIVSDLILYFQHHGRYGGLAPEKSALNISPSFAATGVKKRRNYQLAAHDHAYDGGEGIGVLDEFLKATDGIDWQMEYTPSSRVLRGYYPNFAPHRADLPLLYRNYPEEPASNVTVGIIGWDYADTLDTAANQIVVLGGWGSAADEFASREEGGYSDPSTLGGLTLELVETAATGTPVGQLNGLAAARGAQVKNGVATPIFTVHEGRDQNDELVGPIYVGVLVPGMTVPLVVEDGTLQIHEASAEVASVALDATTMELKVTFNP